MVRYSVIDLLLASSGVSIFAAVRLWGFTRHPRVAGKPRFGRSLGLSRLQSSVLLPPIDSSRVASLLSNDFWGRRN
jgi:hypothetical protein